jgi:hypothetical protein
MEKRKVPKAAWLIDRKARREEAKEKVITLRAMIKIKVIIALRGVPLLFVKLLSV